MFQIIVSLWVWAGVFVIGALYFPIALAIWAFTSPFDQKRTLLHLFSSFWGATYLWINPHWKVKIVGREKINRNKTYIMVCNHQSMLDIMVLYRLYVHYKWVSKAELFKIPVLGWNMRLNRYISVNRASKKSHLHMMKQCEETLKSGSSIMIFPEGTRSEDGNIHSFKEGAFKLAHQAKSDILPIILNGTSDSLPKKGFILTKSQNIVVEVFDPIPYESFANLSTKDLTDMVHNYMVDHFNHLKR